MGIEVIIPITFINNLKDTGHLGETWKSLGHHMQKRSHFNYKTFP